MLDVRRYRLPKLYEDRRGPKKSTGIPEPFCFVEDCIKLFRHGIEMPQPVHYPARMLDVECIMKAELVSEFRSIPYVARHWRRHFNRPAHAVSPEAAMGLEIAGPDLSRINDRRHEAEVDRRLEDKFMTVWRVSSLHPCPVFHIMPYDNIVRNFVLRWLCLRRRRLLF